MTIETPEEREAVRQVCELIARLPQDKWKNVHAILKTALDAPQSQDFVLTAARNFLKANGGASGTALQKLREAVAADSCRRNAAVPQAHPEGRFASKEAA